MTEREEPGSKRTDTTEEHRPTLGEMSHTNPYTGDTFGDTQTYGRGRLVAADGGADPEREAGDEADAEAGTEERDEGSESLRDVDHTPPNDGDGAAPVYERGNEGRAQEDEDVR